MHFRKESCANLSLDDTIKHLQSESRKKYALPEGFPAVLSFSPLFALSLSLSLSLSLFI